MQKDATRGLADEREDALEIPLGTARLSESAQPTGVWVKRCVEDRAPLPHSRGSSMVLMPMRPMEAMAQEEDEDGSHLEVLQVLAELVELKCQTF